MLVQSLPLAHFQSQTHLMLPRQEQPLLHACVVTRAVWQTVGTEARMHGDALFARPCQISCSSTIYTLQTVHACMASAVRLMCTAAA